MDWKTLVSNLIDSLAWPVVVLVIVLSFKNEVVKLLLRLRKFKHNETEIEFGEEMRKLGKEVLDKKGLVGLDAETQASAQYLMKIAEVSPRSAVTEAYRILELAVTKAVARIYPELPLSNIGSYQLHKLAANREILPNFSYQFNKLRKLRNAAVHLDDFDLEEMPVDSYIDMALSLASRLNNLKEK